MPVSGANSSISKRALLGAACEFGQVILGPTAQERALQKPSYAKTQALTAVVGVAAIIAVGLLLGHVSGMAHLPNFVHSHTFQLATEIGSPIGAASAIFSSILITGQKRHALAQEEKRKNEEAAAQRQIEEQVRSTYSTANTTAIFPKGSASAYKKLIDEIQYTVDTVSRITVMNKERKKAAILDVVNDAIEQFKGPYTLSVDFEGERLTKEKLL